MFQIAIDAIGKAIDLPIHVEREVHLILAIVTWCYNLQVIDLKICMIDRLYQDSVIVHNKYSLLYWHAYSTDLLILGHLQPCKLYLIFP